MKKMKMFSPKPSSTLKGPIAQSPYVQLLPRSFFRSLKIDYPLLLGLFCLFFYALIILYSAGGEDVGFVKRQMTHFGIGFIILLFFAHIPPRYFYQWAPYLYIIGAVLVFSVLVIGSSSKGATRWLDLKFIRFQPSEIMKLAVPLMLAHYLDQKILPLRLKELIISCLIIFVPSLAIILQPDLGTGLLIMACGFMVIFLAGLSLKLLFSFAGILIISSPLLWLCLQEYQRFRILMLLNPEKDPLGRGYHIIQSKIAIGSGGITGKGWLKGSQAQLDFLPERTTDFIFGVLAEEFGLIGILILFLIYLGIISRGLYISVNGQDTFSRLLAGSLILTFFVYVFVNTGMVSGILPVVGVPLPLVSYGGTSVVTLMACFGIVMSIHTHRNLLSK